MGVERPHEGFMFIFSVKRGMVPCQKSNGPPAKRGVAPCQKRNGPLPKEEHGPLPIVCSHFRDLEEFTRASRLAVSSRRRACATCGLLLLHFLLNLVLWAPRPQPTTNRAANSLRNLIIWVGALAHDGATRVEGILNQKSQVDRLRDFVVAPSSVGGNSSPLHDSQGADELATLDRYHHFHGHSGLCA